MVYSPVDPPDRDHSASPACAVGSPAMGRRIRGVLSGEPQLHHPCPRPGAAGDLRPSVPPWGSGSQPCLQCSGRPGGPAPPSAANHPRWPGGRRVYRRVGVPSLLAQQRHAQSVQTCRSGKTAPHYRQRVGRLTPATIRSSSWMEWWSHRKDFSGPEWSPRWGVVVGVANDDVAAVGGGWIFQPKVPGLRSQGRPPAAKTSSS